MFVEAASEIGGYSDVEMLGRGGAVEDVDVVHIYIIERIGGGLLSKRDFFWKVPY